MPRCASCNQTVSNLLPCNWDTSLKGVGECCEFHLGDLIETPMEAVCAEEARVFCEAKSVREVVTGIAAHRKTCPICSAFPQPKNPWVREMPKRDELRRAA
jgi:hypothetical protein